MVYVWEWYHYQDYGERNYRLLAEIREILRTGRGMQYSTAGKQRIIKVALIYMYTLISLYTYISLSLSLAPSLLLLPPSLPPSMYISLSYRHPVLFHTFHPTLLSPLLPMVTTPLLLPPSTSMDQTLQTPLISPITLLTTHTSTPHNTTVSVIQWNIQ